MPPSPSVVAATLSHRRPLNVTPAYGFSDWITSGPFIEMLLMLFASSGIFIRSTERIWLLS